MAGISRSTLARLEAGNGGTIDSLARIMRALEIEDRLLDVMPDAKLSPLDPRSDTGKARQRVRKSSEGEAGEEWRSEEHTSELQSLMRISYAVFCLKKKNNHKVLNVQHR